MIASPATANTPVNINVASIAASTTTFNKLPSGSSLTITDSVDSWEYRSPQLQQMTDRTGVWKTVDTVNQAYKTVTFKTPTYNEEGWVKYRILWPKTTNFAEETSTTYMVNVTKVKPSGIWGKTVTDLTELPSVRGFQGASTFTVPNGYSTKNAEIVLQRQLPGKNWQEVSSDSGFGDYAKATTTLTDSRLTNIKGKVGYRFVFKSGHMDVANTYLTAVYVNYPIVTNVATTVTNSNLNGTKRVIDAAVATQKITGTISNTGSSTREVWVQRYNPTAKTWPIQSVQKVSKNYSFTIPSSWPATSYRIHVPASGNQLSYTGASTQIDRPVNNVGISGTRQTYSHAYVPWNQNKISTTLALKDVRATVRFQKRNGMTGNSWSNVVTRTNVGSGFISFDIPKGNYNTKNGVSNWRIYVEPTAYTKATGSAYIHVSVENPLLYTGKWKTVYQHYRNWCPNMLVQFENLPKGTSSKAYTGLNHRISISNYTLTQHQKTAALHECAHFRQWNLYGSDYNGFKNRMTTLYGTNKGFEQNADCVANVWGGKNTFWVAGNNCGSARGTAAKMIASGKKY